MRVEEHEPGPWVVERPEGVREFIALAVRLYAQPEGELGGPLHAQLEDHNTDALVGERGRENREELEAALALIDAGDAPNEKPVQYDPERGWWPDGHHYTTAYEYVSVPETLRIAVEILKLTESWSEEQADAAYAEWAGQYQGGPCGCRRFPVFADKAGSS